MLLNVVADLNSSVTTSIHSQISMCVSAVTSCAISVPGKVDPPVIVFISKMTPIRLVDLAPEDAARIRMQRILDNSNKISQDNLSDKVNEEGDVLMALCRVFAGTLTRDQEYFILSHRHRPQDEMTVSTTTATRVEKNVIGIYLCFGPSIKAVDEMPAGNIVGIIGLEKYVLKTGTLSNTIFCPPMRPISFQAKPILRVAVEPKRHQDLEALERGLNALYQYDPVVEVTMEASGQFTISCLGELHLELCLKALIERFARYDVN